MHLRKLVLLLGVVTLLMARGVFALGLGDITLNSSLNQPLDAHISLLDTGNLSSDQIRVQLASQEAFDRVGLERSYFLSQLRFNVITDSAKGSYIAVTTPDPVREPYLSFIVEVRWSSGRLLREYTVLLDLPTFSDDESARTVQGGATPVRSDSDSGAAQRQSPAQTSSAEREPVQSSPSRQSQSAGRSYSGDTYGPVKDSDTLWEIALQVRPSGASVQQTMLALQKANPEAFINNNINLLRKGQVLRVPADSDIRAMTTRQAISQVAEQNKAWSGSDMGAQLDASGRTGSASRSDSDVSGRVKLAGGDGSGESGQGGGAGSDDGSGLSQQLAETKEELDRAQGENAELRSRVQDLEEQIKTMESLLEASNEQMRALEVAAQQDEQTPEQDQSDTAGEQPAESVAQDQTEASSSVSSEAVAEAPAASEQEQAQDPQPEQDAQPERDTSTVVRRAPEPTLMDRVMDNILWIGLALIAVLVGIALWLRQRSSKNEAADQNDPFVGDDFGGDDIFAEPEAETHEPEAPEQAQSEDLDLDLDDESTDAAESTEAETGDVVSEADIYIAYGKYDQAEEMLRKGLESDPGSMTIKTKLLEVYAESDNLSDFDALYGDVLNNGEDADIARANQLREQFTDAPAFDAQAQSAADTGAPESNDTEEELSLEDLELELNADGPGSESDEDDTLDLSDDFDFELSDGDDEEPEPAPEPATAEQDLETASHRYDLEFDQDESDSDDELLDFDLNLEDEPEPASEPTAQPEPEPASDDDFTLELDEPEPAGAEDDLGDLEFTLDDEPESAPEPEASAEPAEPSDEFDLELDLDEAEPDSEPEPESESLSDTPPLLDEDLSFDELESDDQSEGAQPDDETIPDLETLSTEETQVDEPAYSEPEPYAPSEPEADSDETEKAPTLDLADDDADDFDLDKAMDDFDLEALDKEMEGLDTEFSEQPESSAQPDDEPAAPELDDDDTFEQALADVDQPEQAPAEGAPEMDETPTPESSGEPDDEDLDEDLDFLADSDEVATKLDLARAYIDMGDVDGAKDILSEVTQEGDDTQREEAKALMERIEQ